jgi:hypothetical protein
MALSHLAVTSMNVPARYCTGYLGDIGVSPEDAPIFQRGFEAYLGCRWYTFDTPAHRPHRERARVVIRPMSPSLPLPGRLSLLPDASSRGWPFQAI